MLNLVLAAFLFFLIIFSTFFVIKLPFILLFFQSFPPDVIINYSNSFFSTGFYESNLQIPALIFSALLLNPRLSFFFMLVYYFVGFTKYPIFYFGGGMEYLNEPTVGYLLTFFPITVLLSNLAWKDKNFNRYLYNTRYIFFISIMGLFIIHFVGLITTIIRLYSTVNILDIIETYFLIPFLSQTLIIALVSIFATNLNRLKYYLLGKYMKYIESILKKSVKRGRIISTSN
jgi:biotin transporter BioY